MSERFAKPVLILFCVAWMGAVAWSLFRPSSDPRLDALRQQQFAQQLNTCRGSFSERYECTSTLLRHRSWQRANRWAVRLILLFGPPLAAGAAYGFLGKHGERRREAARQRARLERLERQARGAEPEAGDDEPLSEIDEIRRRADQRRRAARQRREMPDVGLGEPTPEDPAAP